MAIIRHWGERDGRCPSVADVCDRVEKIAGDRGDRRDRRRIRQSLTRLMDLGLVGRDYAPPGASETYRYQLTDDGVVFVAGLSLDRLAEEIEARDPTSDWISEN